MIVRITCRLEVIVPSATRKARESLTLFQTMKSIIKIKIDKIINKVKAGMGRIISTIIICYVAVTYYPLDGIRTVNHYHYNRDTTPVIEVDETVESPEPEQN